jgi:glucosamine kinase
MDRNIFIGIDGGATKCKARVENQDGELLGEAVGGPANIRLSVDMAWDSIYQTIAQVLKQHAISLQDKQYHFHIGLGLAGCEVQEAHADFLSRPHGFSTLQLTTDAHVACMGAHGGEDGSIIIIGTGVVGYQVENGQDSKVGGWGFPHDDEGGGAWLGLEAARHTFQWLDHRIEKTPLLEEVFAYFNKDINHFATWANRATSNEFARLAPLVVNHSQKADVLAVQLMKKAALEINRVGLALEKLQMNKQVSLPCSLFGGIAPFIEPWLSEELRARLVVRQGDANMGAILLVKSAVKNNFSKA